jgi:hypothetical protein
VNTSDLTPDLSALLNAARNLSSELVRQLRDFADFLGARYATAAVRQPQEEWSSGSPEPVTALVSVRGDSADDDDSVDLGALPPDEDVLNLSGILDGDTRTSADLSRVYGLDSGMHSAIGIV